MEWPGYSGQDQGRVGIRRPRRRHDFVTITESGFTGDGDSVLKQATDSTQGFTLVLAVLKAFLEHGLSLNLVADRYPDGPRSQ
jgi:hypothetical protein